MIAFGSMNKILFSLVVTAIFAQAPTPLPFWKEKKDVYKRLIEERAIIVSAKDETVKEGKKLIVIAAGLIDAPENFVYDEIMKFGGYKEFMPYMDETSFDPKTNNVFVHCSFMGY